MMYLYEYRGAGKNPRLLDDFDTYAEAVDALYEMEDLYPMKEYYIESELDEDAL
jgi:hypothetical protein